MFESKPLGELVGYHIGGGTPSRQVPSFWNGDIPWASVKDFTEGAAQIICTQESITFKGLAASASNLIPANTPLVCTRMAVGRAAMPTVPMAINQDVKALYPAQGVNANYLLNLLQYTQPIAEMQAIGSTVKGIRIQDYLAINLPQAPSIEQFKIAEILAVVEDSINKTEAIIEKLKQINQGLAHDLLTRGVDANGELRPRYEEAPHLYRASPSGWIPKNWTFEAFVSKVSFPEGQVDPKKAPFRDWILIAPDHIESGTGRLLATVTAVEQNAISGKYVFAPNDIIYSKIRPYLRKAILASGMGLCSADMYPLRPHFGISPRFILAVIFGNAFSRFAESVSMRSGFPKINRNEMSEFWTGWPDSSEQERISNLLCKADQAQALEESELNKLKKLKTALMDDLLTGRVRVTPLLEGASA